MQNVCDVGPKSLVPPLALECAPGSALGGGEGWRRVTNAGVGRCTVPGAPVGQCVREAVSRNCLEQSATWCCLARRHDTYGITMGRNVSLHTAQLTAAAAGREILRPGVGLRHRGLLYGYRQHWCAPRWAPKLLGHGWV